MAFIRFVLLFAYGFYAARVITDIFHLVMLSGIVVLACLVIYLEGFEAGERKTRNL